MLIVQAYGLAARAADDGGVFWVYVDVVANVAAARGPVSRALWLVGLTVPSKSEGIWTAIQAVIRIVLPRLPTAILGGVTLVVLRGHGGGSTGSLVKLCGRHGRCFYVRSMCRLMSSSNFVR